MKQLCLSLVIIMIASLSANAQVQYAAKGGLNIDNVTGSGASGATSKVGFHLGALAYIPVADDFHIQPEVVFSLQGAKVPGGKVNYDYLNIPVLAKYTIAKGLDLEAGPQFGFLLSSHFIDNGGTSTDIMPNYKSLDLALAIGGSYTLDKNMGFDLRYNFGLTNIVLDAANPVHNSVLQVGAFYFFNTK